MVHSKKELVFLTITGEDRSGIIADVTRILWTHDCNLEDASMTLLDGKFAMMMAFTALFAKNVDLLECKLRGFEKEKRLSFFLKRFGVLKNIKHKNVKYKTHKTNSPSYLISAMGPDQAGIVCQISQALAKIGLNITDLNTKIIPGRKRTLYSLLLEAPIHSASKVRKLESQLKRISRKLSVDIQIKKVETWDM